MMDMKISGSGTIPAGEYDKINISGSGKLTGFVKCASLHASGAIHGENVACSDDVRISGNAHFEKEIQTDSLHVSGSAHFKDNLTASREVSLSGGVDCEGNIKCGKLQAFGSLYAKDCMEAETVRICGCVVTGGLLNAEDIEIKMEGSGKNTVGSIGCSKLLIERRKAFKLFGIHNGTLKVKDEIEGDEIDIEHVICPRVSGRTVKIGKGCEIALLQYSESYDIDPKAKIGKIEKI